MNVKVSSETMTSAAGWMPSVEASAIDRAQATGFQLTVKRLIDIVVSGTALVVLMPLFAFCALAIRLESRGPVLFKQARWGQGGRVIKVYKFQQTVAGDKRITKLGAILRKSNIDELPQLINVLKGDMSLVGPRCHAVGMKAAGVLYEELVPAYHLRHMMRPGITGLAQMRGLRGPTDTVAKSRARIASDLHYVQNFSLALDVKVILGTIKNEVFNSSGF